MEVANVGWGGGREEVTFGEEGGGRMGLYKRRLDLRFLEKLISDIDLVFKG